MTQKFPTRLGFAHINGEVQYIFWNKAIPSHLVFVATEQLATTLEEY